MRACLSALVPLVGAATLLGTCIAPADVQTAPQSPVVACQEAFLCAYECYRCWGDDCEQDESCTRQCASRHDVDPGCGSRRPEEFGVALAWGCDGESIHDGGSTRYLNGRCPRDSIGMCSCPWDHYECTDADCPEPMGTTGDDSTGDTGTTSSGDSQSDTGDDSTTGDTGDTSDGSDAEPDLAHAWTRQWGTAVGDDCADVVVDELGNVYVAGSTRGKLGAANENAGGWDAVLVRFDATGAWQWTRQWGSAGHDRATALALDPSGHVWVAGVAGGSMPGATHDGLDDVFVARFAPDGTRTLLAQWGSTADDVATDVVLLLDGSLRVVGVTGSDWSRVGKNDLDLFAADFDTDGQHIGVRTWGSSADEIDVRVVGDSSSGNTFLAGTTLGDLANSNAGRADVFLLGYSATDSLWSRQWGGAEFEQGQALALLDAQSLYVAGSGEGDVFLVQFDVNGTLHGVRWWGSSGIDSAHALAVAPNGRVYVMGTTRGQLGEAKYGEGDVFISAFEDLTAQWHVQFGTSARDAALAAVVGQGGELVIVGHTHGDLGGPSAGESDGFVSKWEPGERP